MEEGPVPGDEPPSCPASPGDAEPGSDPDPHAGSPPPPSEGAPRPDPGGEPRGEEPAVADMAAEVACEPGGTESQASARVPEGDTAPPETVASTTLETPPGPDGPDDHAQKEAELTLEVPAPEGTQKESSAAPAPSPQPPKSCLKHKASSAGVSRSASPTPLASEPPQGVPAPGSLDKEAAPPGIPKAEQVQCLQGGPERKAERGGSEPRSVKKLPVSACRLRPHSGSVHLPEGAGPVGHSGVRLPLLKSGLVWRSEAALDLQVLPEPLNGKRDPAECGTRDPGDTGSQAAQGGSPQEVAATPATSDPCPAAQEPPAREDRSPFPVKLRSTSLSFKYRAASSPEQKGIKRYSAELRLEKAGLTLLSKDEKGQIGAAPSARGARSPSDRGKAKAPAPEQLSCKPPLPRKPLLQALTLPPPPAAPLASPGELEKAVTPGDSRKESRVVQRKPPRVAEKGSSPAAAGPGTDGQPMPAWVTIARQKRRGAPDQPPNQEDRPGVWSLKSEMGKPAKGTERVQESTKQADFVRSKSFLIVPAKPAVERKEGTTLHLKEGLQRGISLSHQNLAAQSAAMTEKDLSQLKRASYASADQPSWMELARKKAQAWSDMPQIIK